jgi:predicted ester cyclase
MSAELKAKIKRVIEEAWNQGKLDGLDEIFAPNYVHHRPPFAAFEGLEALKKHITDSRASYPDVKLTIDELIVEGDWSASLWTWGGTQSGVSPTSGAPPTNKYVEFRGCSMTRWEGGKAVEEWALGDFLGLFEQLGVVTKSW